VVNDEIDRHLWVDPLRIATELGNSVPHCGKVNNGWNAREVLHQHTGWTIGDLPGGFPGFQPVFDRRDVCFVDGAAIFKAEQVFKQHFQAEGETGYAFQAIFFGLLQIVIDVVLGADFEV